jgi:uncharacterized protein YecE (DUF72 family)
VIRVGPAGWSYEDWKGKVYPEPRPRRFDELRYLSAYFDTIEINSTFYRPANRRTAERWAERVADRSNFRFTLKLWNRFTHERATKWTAADVFEARHAIDALTEADRLGAVLAQFPWSFQRTDESRAWLAQLTQEFAAVPLVVEIRHVSWDIEDFYDSLRERGVGFVNIDQPRHRSGIQPTARVTSPVGYVRVHGRNDENWFRRDAGVNERYDYLYTTPELLPWAERVRRIAEEADDIYVITNNHFQGQAVANAAMLESMLQGRPVAVPPPVVERYGAVLDGYTDMAASEDSARA